MVRYTTNPKENTLTLPIPLEHTVNKDELKAYEAVAEAEKDKKEKTPAPKAIIPFQACVDSFLEPELVEGFRSPATGQIGNALKTTRLANFPPYLVVKMRRYVLAADWTPKKLDARVEVPQSFDFSSFRGYVEFW
jgi:ubiquitin carboxyl-terminal hydrolase 5/13